MLLKALKIGFVENKGQSGPLSVVSKTQDKINVSCQLNFRLFAICHLSVISIQTNLKFQDKPILRTHQESVLQPSLFWRYANFP